MDKLGFIGNVPAYFNFKKSPSTISNFAPIGTDEFALCRLLRTGHADNCTVFAAWKGYEGFPAKVRASIRQFKEYGGHIVWGPAGKNEALVKTALLMRNIRLVDACYGLVAPFMDLRSSRATSITASSLFGRRDSGYVALLLTSPAIAGALFSPSKKPLPNASPWLCLLLIVISQKFLV
ncbi:hypothetical protein EBR57_02480 [bacterium]|nr:hypothetical protein [bacterium]